MLSPFRGTLMVVTEVGLIYPLILISKQSTILTAIKGGNPMSDAFGSDFMTIVDEDGTEYELEVLSTLEYNGAT